MQHACYSHNSTLLTSGEVGYTRQQKIDSAVREHCLTIFNHGAKNSIDEAMIPFKVSGGIVLLTSSVLYIGHLSSSSVACTKHCLQPINWLQQVVTTMFTGKFLHSKHFILL